MSGPQEPLVCGYDLVIFDLDGVVYLVDHPIPGATETIAHLRRAGRQLAYATNNASRRAAEVAAMLCGMGVEAKEAEVLTSAQAAAAVLARRLPTGSPVLVVGAQALRADVRGAGLRVVDSADDRPAAVVQGYGPAVGWADLAEATLAIRAGAWWVATNTDRTLPTTRGPLPGNGALVAAVRTALGRGPDVVVGKPEPTLLRTAVQRSGAARPLAVGDRLDTDIEGARRSGMDSLLVLTGVSRPRDLLAAPPRQRPTHVSTDLSGLFEMDDTVRVPQLAEGSDGAAADGWRVTRRDMGLELAGSGDRLTALRLLCALAWTGGQQPWPDGRPAEVTATSRAAADVLLSLGFDS